MNSVILPRRGFLKRLIGLVAAPAIVKAESLMPIKVWATPIRWREGFVVLNGAMVQGRRLSGLVRHLRPYVWRQPAHFPPARGRWPRLRNADVRGRHARCFLLPARETAKHVGPSSVEDSRHTWRKAWMDPPGLFPGSLLSESIGRAATSRVRPRSSRRGCGRFSSSAVRLANGMSANPPHTGPLMCSTDASGGSVPSRDPARRQSLWAQPGLTRVSAALPQSRSCASLSPALHVEKTAAVHASVAYAAASLDLPV
jgi:hypothetical protein